MTVAFINVRHKAHADPELIWLLIRLVRTLLKKVPAYLLELQSRILF